MERVGKVCRVDGGISEFWDSLCVSLLAKSSMFHLLGGGVSEAPPGEETPLREEAPPGEEAPPMGGVELGS